MHEFGLYIRRRGAPGYHPAFILYCSCYGYNTFMSKTFTGRGDDGTTGTLGPNRIRKDDIQPETYGTVDELSAALAVARAYCKDPAVVEVVIEIQRDLFNMMSELAAAPDLQEKFRKIDAARVSWLEESVRQIEQIVDFPSNFIISGDTPAAAHFDLARTIARRAERRVVALYYTDAISNPEILRYLNRLSSLLFLCVLLETTRDGRPLTFANRTSGP